RSGSQIQKPSTRAQCQSVKLTGIFYWIPGSRRFNGSWIGARSALRQEIGMCSLAQQGQSLGESAGRLQGPVIQGGRNGQCQPLKAQALWRYLQVVGHLGNFM